MKFISMFSLQPCVMAIQRECFVYEGKNNSAKNIHRLEV